MTYLKKLIKKIYNNDDGKKNKNNKNIYYD